MVKAALKPGLPPPPKNKEELWSVLCHLQEFTLPDLKSRHGLPVSSVWRQVNALVKSGHVRKIEAGRFLVVLPRSARPSVGLDGSEKQPSGRQKMWMGMKAAKTFSYHDVALFAGVSREAARFYCLMLKRGGYLRVLRPAGKNSNAEVYMFNTDKNTGSQAPTVSNDKKSLYDPNLRKTVWSESEDA